MHIVGHLGFAVPRALHTPLSLCNPGPRPQPCFTNGETQVSVACPDPAVANRGLTLRPRCSQDVGLKDIFKGYGSVQAGKTPKCRGHGSLLAGWFLP